MAFLGKVGILIGAGILGSVFAKDSQMPSFSDVVRGAYKIVLNPISQRDSGSPAGKPKNDALAAQIFNLKREVQMLGSNMPVTIVTTSAGGRRSGVIVLVVAAGTVFIWWKGWIPDLNFATRRSLSNARDFIEKQLEEVYSSIRTTRRDLSSQMDNTNSSVNELLEQQSATKDEVSHLRGEVDTFGVNIQTSREAAENMERTVHRLQAKEDIISTKVMIMVQAVQNIEKQRSAGTIQGSSSSSKLAIEPPPLSPSSRSVSLPPALTIEERSPTASSTTDVQLPPRRSRSPNSGLKDVGGISTIAEVSRSPNVSSGTQSSSESNGSATNGGIFSRFPSGGSFLLRTRSAIQGFK